MSTSARSDLTPETWRGIIASAFALFDDIERRGFGTPPFSLGGGTALMLRFRHRLSKDIDFFGYDAQWLSVLSPRLNAASAALVEDYVEQANTIKLVMRHGDIDFIVAGDIAVPVTRTLTTIGARQIEVEPTAEILAKKLYYRAAGFKPRDVYDMATALDLAPDAAAVAMDAALPQAEILLRRLDELGRVDPATLLDGIVPHDGALRHAAAMVSRVADYARSRRERARAGKPPAVGSGERAGRGVTHEAFGA